MSRRPLALLLLAAFAVGLAIGPHPCWAEAASAPGRPERSEGSGWGSAPAGHHGAEAAPAAGHDCHGAAAESPADAPGDDTGTDRLLCERACQAVAVLGLPPVTLAVTPLLAGLAAVQPASTVPLLVLSIDHVPLV